MTDPAWSPTSRRWIFTSKHSRCPAASVPHSTASSDAVHVSARWVLLIAVWWSGESGGDVWSPKGSQIDRKEGPYGMDLDVDISRETDAVEEIDAAGAWCDPR